MTALDTWAVFSAYRPSSSLIQAVESVRAQVANVIVVDDGSGADAHDVLESLRATGVQVDVRGANEGIAAALNRGITAALQAGASHVVTFDQDSHVPDGFVEALLAAKDRAQSDGVRVGAVVPEYFAGVRQGRGAVSSPYSSAAQVIQSGMLIPSEVLHAVGLLREDFFIDLVDTEFELRLRRADLSVIAAHGVRLAHSLGAKYHRAIFGCRILLPGVPAEITLSSPFRYFYRVRNRCVLTREYIRIAPAAVLRSLAFDLIHFLDALRVARPRRNMWRIQRAGLNAGWHRRMGPMPSGLVPVAAQVRWGAEPVDDGADE